MPDPIECTEYYDREKGLKAKVFRPFAQEIVIKEGKIMEEKNSYLSYLESNQIRSIEVKVSDEQEMHSNILDEIHDTYIRKNADYGSSFSEQFREFGLLSLVIRLNDKMLRLKQLSKQESLVKEESIRDTLLDLSNYAIMGVMELDKKQNKT